MISSEKIKQQLQKEGFSDFHEYSDAADELFVSQDHQGDQRLYVLGGSLSIEIGGEERNLIPGDEYFFPARVKRSLKTGPEGCEYVIGEKIES